jgi:acid stress-induced BolA-like protein IbaG/YrbA
VRVSNDELAKALMEALDYDGERNVVSGDGSHYDRVFIDGYFDLTVVAQRLRASIPAPTA